MSLALDPQTEQRIQRLLERGHYESADQIINLALDPFEPMEEWLQRNKEAIDERLEESLAQAARGEVYTPEEVRSLLAQDRTSRRR
jgi:Arc/MetJ-type ribon-helix-helix transcriptional regulator